MADPFVLNDIPVTINSGQSLSGPVDVGGWTLTGIFLPANWTTAGLSFQESPDGGTTWGELWDATTAAALTVGNIAIPSSTPVFLAFDPAKWRAARSLKVRSGTQGSPVNQMNAVTLSLLARFVF